MCSLGLLQCKLSYHAEQSATNYFVGDLEARRLNVGTRRNSFREIVLVAPTPPAPMRAVCASVIIKAQIEIVSVERIFHVFADASVKMCVNDLIYI